MAGRRLIELGDPSAPEPLLSSAIADYRAREITLYRMWLAEAYARSGVLDAARDTIGRARSSAVRISSVRLEQQIADVERLLPS